MSEVLGGAGYDWLSLLKEELPDVHSAYQEFGFEQAGLHLDALAEEDHAGVAGYWHAFLDEMRVLLCTEDEKYEQLRERIRAWCETADRPIALMIGVAIGDLMGIDGELLVGFVALVLGELARVGLAEWCRKECDG